MADENGPPTATDAPPQGRKWAVVATGFVGADYIPQTFRDSKDRPAPIIVRLCNDEPDARRHMKRVRSAAGRVEYLGDSSVSVVIPIYGVMETDIVAGPKRAGNPNAFGRGTPAATPTGRKPKSK